MSAVHSTASSSSSSLHQRPALMALADRATGPSHIHEGSQQYRDVVRETGEKSSTKNDDDEEDDDDQIATIQGMTINIDDSSARALSSNPSHSSRDTKASPSAPSSSLLAPARVAEGNIRPSASSPNGSGKDVSPAKVTSLRSVLGVPPSAGRGNSLSVPPSTSSLTAPPGIGGASGARIGGGKTLNKDGLETLPSEIAPKRRKVVLGPGCSALDWARLKSTIPSRGFRKITPSELKTHKSLDDAWSAFNGKVYDLTPYMRFHPGGKEEMMRVAGRDGTRLFMLTHSWVNIDNMIGSCIVGVLVPEPPS